MENSMGGKALNTERIPRDSTEAGVGLICWNAESTSEYFEDLSIVPNIGYRYLSNNGFLFRIRATR
jgi:hypothetical protein